MSRLAVVGNKVRLGLLLLFVLLFPGVGWWLDSWKARGRAEPTWKGKPLSKWIARWDWHRHEPSPESVEAVRAIGTNALPFLLQWMMATNTPTEESLSWRDQQLRWQLGLLMPQERGMAAAHAIGSLGELAKPAIPELVRRSGGKREERQWAWLALRELGDVAVPELTEGLRSTNATIRSRSARSLGDVGVGAGSAEDGLIRALSDPSSSVRCSALDALPRIGTPASRALPMILPQLDDPDELVRDDAVGALKAYGTEARSALPILLRYVTNSACMMPNRTWKAIRAIDPTVPVPPEFK